MTETVISYEDVDNDGGRLYHRHYGQAAAQPAFIVVRIGGGVVWISADCGATYEKREGDVLCAINPLLTPCGINSTMDVIASVMATCTAAVAIHEHITAAIHEHIEALVAAFDDCYELVDVDDETLSDGWIEQVITDVNAGSTDDELEQLTTDAADLLYDVAAMYSSRAAGLLVNYANSDIHPELKHRRDVLRAPAVLFAAVTAESTDEELYRVASDALNAYANAGVPMTYTADEIVDVLRARTTV